MANFTRWGPEEIAFLHTLLEDALEKDLHYPGELDEDSREVLSRLWQELYQEARNQKIWWAMY